MRIFAKALWIVLAGAAIACADGFKAGVARTDITPPVPYWLSGYASRTNAATAVRNRLWAKALAVEDDRGGRAVLVTLDIIGLPREITDDVAARALRQHGLERSQLLMNFSHTHYGPVIRHNLSVMYDFDAAMQEKVARYSAKLADDLVALVGAALADLKPATLSCGHGTAGFAGNRRQKAETGYRIGVNPEGPVDHDVPVLAVTGADGRLRAALFGYACHNTTMSGGHNEVDSDYAGFAQRAVEEAHPGATAMFMMLCGSDQNPNPRGEYAHVEQHGRELADTVNRTLAGPLQPVLPPIRTAVRVARLDLAPHDRAVFEAEAADTKSNRWKQRRAKQMLEDYDRGVPMRQVEVPVQCIRFHTNLTVVALGGEVVVDYALRTKREFPAENLVVAGYSHDVMSYIPSLRVLREGGYEAVDSMIYYGKPGPYAESAEESLFAAIREVLKATGVRSNPLPFRYVEGQTEPRTEIRDPCIVRDGDTYYLVFTMWPFRNREERFLAEPNQGGSPGIALYSSRNLMDWEFENWLVRSADLPEDCPYKNRFWAPEIHRMGGKFYLVFTADNWIRKEYNPAGTWGTAGYAFVGVSDRIGGPYQHITYVKGAACDTSLFEDTDGRTYALIPRRDIDIQEIDLTGLSRGEVKLLGQPQKVVACENSDIGLEATPEYLEGPWMEKMDGKYFLFYAAIHRDERFPDWLGYWTGVAYAGSVTGPWKKDPRGRVFCGGHLAVFTGTDGRRFFSYRWERDHRARGRLCVDPLDMGADGRVQAEASLGTVPDARPK